MISGVYCLNDCNLNLLASVEGVVIESCAALLILFGPANALTRMLVPELFGPFLVTSGPGVCVFASTFAKMVVVNLKVKKLSVVALSK